jgi:glycosyltransferase involved in cell wall biosynthesis
VKPLKICIFTETYYPVVGGGENQARSLAESLADKGYSVVILTRRSDSSLKSIEGFGFATVYRLPPVGDGQLRKWGLLLTSLPALVKLRRQYDLLFVSGFRRVGIAAVLISKMLKKGCVLKADSLGEFSGNYFAAGLEKIQLLPSSMIFQPFLWLQRNILKQANAFVAICSDIVSELMTYGVSSRNIIPIPNSVDTNKFFPANQEEKYLLRQKLEIPQNERVVIFTGRLVTYKGLPLLLRVWKKIQQEHSNVRLMLLGSGGSDIHNCEEDLKIYVKVNGLEDSVQFMGSIDNVCDYLRASDIFVFPSENEAFPLSLIEAMACGLPVISTSAGGIKDVLKNGTNGLVVGSGDYQQLHDAIANLLTDIPLSDDLGQAAWRSVRHRYSTEFVTNEYIQLFERISGLRGKKHGSLSHGSSDLM